MSENGNDRGGRARRTSRAGGGDAIHPVDAQMLARLGAIVAVVDPVPDALLESGRALFALRDPGARLMEVVDLEQLAGSAVRASGSSPMHFFELGNLSLDVELSIGAGGVTVLGAVTTSLGEPPEPGWTAVVETTTARYDATPDAEGRFTVRGVPRGLLRLHLDRPGEPRLTTPWVDVD